MKSISYDPKIVDVSVGDSVVWTNKAFSRHTATSEAPLIIGEIKPSGKLEPVKFDKEGHCKIHG